MDVPDFKRTNLAETVFGVLKEKILTGKLKGGERLPTQEVLAQQFGVSRTVMREAINKLSSLGLIESQQGRGTFVLSPDTKMMMESILDAILLHETSIREIIETRYYLERIIAKRAARKATPEHIVRLRELIMQMEDHLNKGDWDALAKGDFAFHLTLAEISDNRVLKGFLDTIQKMKLYFMEEISYVKEARQEAFESHKRIFQAVAQHDEEKAKNEMQQHILTEIKILDKSHHYNFDI